MDEENNDALTVLASPADDSDAPKIEDLVVGVAAAPPNMEEDCLGVAGDPPKTDVEEGDPPNTDGEDESTPANSDLPPNKEDDFTASLPNTDEPPDGVAPPNSEGVEALVLGAPKLVVAPPKMDLLEPEAAPPKMEPVVAAPPKMDADGVEPENAEVLAGAFPNADFDPNTVELDPEAPPKIEGLFLLKIPLEGEDTDGPNMPVPVDIPPAMVVMGFEGVHPPIDSCRAPSSNPGKSFSTGSLSAESNLRSYSLSSQPRHPGQVFQSGLSYAKKSSGSCNF